MRKLVIFTGTLTYGGAERVISILCEELVKEFDEVEIVLYYDTPIWYSINDKVKITVINKKNGKKSNIFKKAIWFRKYIKAIKPEAVISFLAPFNMFAIISLLKSKVPLIVAERNDPRYIPKRGIIRLLRNILYIFTDKIVVQTQNNKQYFNKILQRKIDIIYNPVLIKEDAGSALKYDKKDKIVTVGRLVPQKNQKMQIEAFKNIHLKYPEYKLVIYGEGDLREELNKMINEYNLEDIIELAGVKQNIHECILDAKIFILTSQFEGMPNALIEAMCLGLPCISTKVSGATDLIQHGKNGILIEKDDCEALEISINQLLNDKQYADDLGEEASKVKEILSINEISNQWIRIIKDLV